MKNIRIIPQLNIKGPNVVKPVNTEGLKVVGNPRDLAMRYYQEGADEIIYLDVVASLYQRNLDFDQLKKVCAGIFIPFTVGGGIRSLDDINNALRAGADKIAINTYAVNNPNFISRAIKIFGSQCIVLFVEAKRTGNKKWEAYTDGGREKTGVDAIEWIKKAIKLGVGEILITSVDHDGRRQGYEIDLMKEIASFSPVPVIAHGGAGTPEMIKEVILEGRADAVSASSILHYGEYSLKEIKRHLAGNNINVRLI
ncbi:imidazole glycerol phosphate synthase subunit HisF [Candidatus Falkowbacteria bacterium CG10_big_fil_rev_8_21_14_0_10_43_10]|uniref:imidazole glycerol-phosphate synthase n=1 Tax=Candidatus Falkowbacteria bacterium CG10_big_fil_rev_8_21_14_0_10_43_10 TaxID=1974567 RepID=A0A2H0V236_9BACT|nr:MAG: imidazole glycerol phosphate synthase subunit HisF [Candidatus Falkowbacteria bacterium CG10_big_fil_rev_8_21_14_0_10_43_10]